MTRTSFLGRLGRTIRGGTAAKSRGLRKEDRKNYEGNKKIYQRRTVRLEEMGGRLAPCSMYCDCSSFNLLAGYDYGNHFRHDGSSLRCVCRKREAECAVLFSHAVLWFLCLEKSLHRRGLRGELSHCKEIDRRSFWNISLWSTLTNPSATDRNCWQTYSSSRNTRHFSREICAQSDTCLHREYNLAMKNKSIRRIAAVQRRRCFAPCAARTLK